MVFLCVLFQSPASSSHFYQKCCLAPAPGSPYTPLPLSPFLCLPCRGPALSLRLTIIILRLFLMCLLLFASRLRRRRSVMMRGMRRRRRRDRCGSDSKLSDIISGCQVFVWLGWLLACLLGWLFGCLVAWASHEWALQLSGRATNY